MDNVLVDERRIHVDFSQSVAKQWNRWRRNGKFDNKVDSLEVSFSLVRGLVFSR